MNADLRNARFKFHVSEFFADPDLTISNNAYPEQERPFFKEQIGNLLFTFLTVPVWSNFLRKNTSHIHISVSETIFSHPWSSDADMDPFW